MYAVEKLFSQAVLSVIILLYGDWISETDVKE